MYVEESILTVERFSLNGGRHGFLVEIRPEDLRRLLDPAAVRVAIERGAS